jgi:hypothetical protein
MDGRVGRQMDRRMVGLMNGRSDIYRRMFLESFYRIGVDPLLGPHEEQLLGGRRRPVEKIKLWRHDFEENDIQHNDMQ